MKLGACDSRDVLLATAGQQAPGKAGNGRIPARMVRREACLAANAGGKTTGDQRNDQQDNDGHDIADAVDSQGMDRRREEEIVGESCRDSRDERRSKTPQHGDRKHRRQVDHVDRRGSPAGRDPQAHQRGNGHQRNRARVGLNSRGDRTIGSTSNKDLGRRFHHDSKMRVAAQRVECLLRWAVNPHGIFTG